MIDHNQTSKQSGFALLITLLVVSVVVAVSAAIIELSIKQLELSVTARDSEIAFHAANAGLECARYIQRTEGEDILLGTTLINSNCFGVPTTVTSAVATGVGFSGTPSTHRTIRRYVNNAGITWSGDRCTKLDMLVTAVRGDASSDLTISGLNSIYPGYTTGDKVCPIGSTCYVVAVSGYNKDCSNLTAADTVRREVLLEF